MVKAKTTPQWLDLGLVRQELVLDGDPADKRRDEACSLGHEQAESLIMVKITSLRPNVDLLEIEDKKVYLVGTAHVSEESVQLAEEIIREIQPEAVAVELCPSRFSSIRDADRWKNTDIVSVIRSGRSYVLLAQLLLAAFQKKIGKDLKVQPGAEMVKAIEVAEDTGAAILLADRDIKVTLRRVWASLTWKSLTKMIGTALDGILHPKTITKEEVERLKSSDALEAVLKEFADTFPEVREALITERDRYLAAKMKEGNYRTVVAIIGAGHTPGIRKFIGESYELAPLEVVPPRGATRKVLSIGIPLLVLGTIGYGLLYSSDTGATLAWSWIVIVAFFTALGALLARAHPLTMLCAVLVSPVTTLNPFLRCGWIAALVEATLRKPRVSDMETVTDDIMSLKGWYGNRVRRILLVMILVNLLGLLGSIVGASIVATYLTIT